MLDANENVSICSPHLQKRTNQSSKCRPRDERLPIQAIKSVKPYRVQIA